MRGTILLGWPVAVALAGGYSRLTAEPRRFHGRALLAAALAAATAVWSLPTLIPGAGTDESPRTVAAAALLLAALVFLGSATARGVLALAAPAQAVPTVLVGHWSQVRELLEEAAPAGQPARVRPRGRVPARPRVGRRRPRTGGLARAGDGRRVRRPPGDRAHPARRSRRRRPRTGDHPRRPASLGRPAPARERAAPGEPGAARRRLEPDRNGDAGRHPVGRDPPGSAHRSLPTAQGRRGPGRGRAAPARARAAARRTGPADPGRLPRPGPLPADPRRMARPAVHRLQAAHDVRRRRPHPQRPRGQERVRPERRAVQDEARSADHPRRARSSASAPSTSCPS